VTANIKYANRDNPIDQAAIFHNQIKEGRFITMMVDVKWRRGERE
jgi:hypothetical protein